MTIRQLQKNIADALNGVEALVQGGCRAFAEDSMNVVFEVARVLNEGGVTIVVVTPNVNRSGSGGGEGLPVEITLSIQCSEIPALNREATGHLTALDAAEIVAHELDGETLEFTGIQQTADERRKIITATVTFGLETILTHDEPNERN